jgi:hypothetical protein
MSGWSPASREQVEALIEEQISSLSTAQLELFSRIRVPLRSVPISRGSSVEFVYVVAQQGNVVVYYEDVEEGFNISELAPDGSIARPGYEQWELSHALSQLAA